MNKNFKHWNGQKEAINEKKINIQIFFREREIWWVALGLNIGFEQDGKGSHYRRPALIIRKFSAHLAVIVPLTTKNKENNKYYIACPAINDSIQRMAIISQIRSIDTKRLASKLGTVDQKIFMTIKNEVRSMF